MELLAFVFVRTGEQGGDCSAGEGLSRIPEVQEVHNITGEDCYLVKIRTVGTSELGRLIRERIGIIPLVTSTRTTIALEAFKETIMLSMGPAIEGLTEPQSE